VDVAAGRARTAAAHWLAGSAGRLAGARRPGQALAVRRLNWLLPGRRCAFRRVLHASSELRTGVKSAVYDCFVCKEKLLQS